MASLAVHAKSLRLRGVVAKQGSLCAVGRKNGSSRKSSSNNRSRLDIDTYICVYVCMEIDRCTYRYDIEKAT